MILLTILVASLARSKEFAHGIRGHWGIENRLHWVKDVVLNEDLSTIHMGDAPANISVVRAIVLNVLRRNGYDSITTAQRFLSNDIDKLLILLE
ncbi:MAG: transposase [Symploca sp. SIO3E6]|nr:transposase [Caldora sp. SIO3E6]